MSTRLARLTQLGWPRDFPVVQFPNAPLAVALVASVAGHFLDGKAHGVARALFFLGLGVWAYVELTQGVNWFRRVLGAVGLVYAVLRLGAALDG